MAGVGGVGMGAVSYAGRTAWDHRHSADAIARGAVEGTKRE